MSNKFSFDTADEVVCLLKSSSSVLEQKNVELMRLGSDLNEFFKDDGYDEFEKDITAVYKHCQEVINEINKIAESIDSYKERMKELLDDGNSDDPVFGEITYGLPVLFGAAGVFLERKNRLLEFQNEIKLLLNDKNVPTAAKKAYLQVGRRCVIADNEYNGVPHYDPFKKHIKFDLKSDLDNPCGRLSTYFHEVGHMMDFQANSSHKISDDKEFKICLESDCNNYVNKVMKRYGCTKDTAYWYISQELRAQNDLYADVSDIMGGLTNGQCQNLWGHSRSYWNLDSSRIYREAFANMFSTSMTGSAKIDAMKKYFPTAYSRFEKLLEDIK